MRLGKPMNSAFEAGLNNGYRQLKSPVGAPTGTEFAPS